MDAVYLTVRSINAIKRTERRSDSKAADLEVKTEKTKYIVCSCQ